VSDFLMPSPAIEAALDVLAGAWVVPIVVTDPAEQAAPPADAWLDLADMETGARRSVWLGARARRDWQARAEAHARALTTLFAARGLRPFRMQGRFDAEALSRHFLEAGA
jgi:hypothetical protein